MTIRLTVYLWGGYGLPVWGSYSLRRRDGCARYNGRMNLLDAWISVSRMIYDFFCWMPGTGQVPMHTLSFSFVILPNDFSDALAGSFFLDICLAGVFWRTGFRIRGCHTALKKTINGNHEPECRTHVLINMIRRTILNQQATFGSPRSFVNPQPQWGHWFLKFAALSLTRAQSFFIIFWGYSGYGYWHGRNLFAEPSSGTWSLTNQLHWHEQ